MISAHTSVTSSSPSVTLMPSSGSWQSLRISLASAIMTAGGMFSRDCEAQQGGQRASAMRERRVGGLSSGQAAHIASAPAVASPRSQCAVPSSCRAADARCRRGDKGLRRARSRCRSAAAAATFRRFEQLGNSPDRPAPSRLCRLASAVSLSLVVFERVEPEKKGRHLLSIARSACALDGR